MTLAMLTEQQLLTFITRESFGAFAERCFNTVSPGDGYLHNWHREAIAHALERVRRGEVKRLIIAMPPRSLKSIYASVAFPAFLLGHNPTHRIICVSYADNLAGKHADDCRAVMRSSWYREAFPRTVVDPKKDSRTEFTTTRRGFRFATSVGGTLTGRDADTIIIDDPMKAQDAMSEAERERVGQWFTNTLLSRLDDKRTGAIILVMQRLHVDDLAGRLIEGGGWEVLKLPAIAEIDEVVPIGPGLVHHRRIGDVLHPEREPRDILDGIKATLGSLASTAQWQQEPVAPEGNLIKREWLQHYDHPPEPGRDDRTVLSWDVAQKVDERSDYSVCTVWRLRKDTYYLLDVVRKRFEFPDLLRAAKDLHARWRPTAHLIEDKGSGTPLIQALREAGIRPLPYQPQGDKAFRFGGQSAKFEAGSVILPKSAPWLGDFEAELLAFPKGRHDDQVDSLAQALEWASRPYGRPRIRFL